MQPDVLDHSDLDQIDASGFEELDTSDPAGVIALIAGAISGASIVALIWLFTALFF